jgi:hypothetical protein
MPPYLALAAIFAAHDGFVFGAGSLLALPIARIPCFIEPAASNWLVLSPLSRYACSGLHLVQMPACTHSVCLAVRFCDTMWPAPSRGNLAPLLTVGVAKSLNGQAFVNILCVLVRQCFTATVVAYSILNPPWMLLRCVTCNSSPGQQDSGPVIRAAARLVTFLLDVHSLIQPIFSIRKWMSRAQSDSDKSVGLHLCATCCCD